MSAAVMTGTSSIRRHKMYPFYKASGVAWLKDIPAHWFVTRLKYAAPIVTVTKLTNKPIDLPYIGLENIESGMGRLCPGTSVEEVDGTVGVFCRGDILFGKLRPYLAKVVDATFDGVCSTEVLVLRPCANVDGRYLFYRLLSDDFINLVNSLTYGAKMPRANPEQIGAVSVALPPMDEQRAIAAFLDRETVKIDALIAKKDRLIKVLEEKRVALIDQMVTKGLDHTAFYKTTSLPELDRLPAHWKLQRLKTATSYVTSGSRGWAEYYSDEGSIFIRIGNLSRTSIHLDLTKDVQCVKPPHGAEGERTRVHGGDVLISITAYIGSIAVAPNPIDEAYINQHIALVRPRKTIITRITLKTRGQVYWGQ